MFALSRFDKRLCAAATQRFAAAAPAPGSPDEVRGARVIADGSIDAMRAAVYTISMTALTELVSIAMRGVTPCCWQYRSMQWRRNPCPAYGFAIAAFGWAVVSLGMTLPLDNAHHADEAKRGMHS
jgi:hypothetical protein